MFVAYVTSACVRCFPFKFVVMILFQVKGLSTEEITARNDLVHVLPDRIQAIPDGSSAAPKSSGGWGTSASAPRTEIKFDSGSLFRGTYLQSPFFFNSVFSYTISSLLMEFSWVLFTIW